MMISKIKTSLVLLLVVMLVLSSSAVFAPTARAMELNVNSLTPDAYAANDGTNFFVSDKPINVSNIIEQSNDNGIILKAISNTYADSGVVYGAVYEAGALKVADDGLKLGDLDSITVYGEIDEIGLNIYFDKNNKNNDKTFFDWEDGKYKGINGDAYVSLQSPKSSNGMLKVTGDSEFFIQADSIEHDSGDYTMTLNELKAKLGSDTPIAIWIGVTASPNETVTATINGFIINDYEGLHEEMVPVYKAANRLIETMLADGKWGWMVGYETPALNCQGITATGLLEAYAVTGFRPYLEVAKRTGDYLLTVPTNTELGAQSRLYPQDVNFLFRLADLSGDSAYAAQAKARVKWVVEKIGVEGIAEYYRGSQYSVWYMSPWVIAAINAGYNDFADDILGQILLEYKTSKTILDIDRGALLSTLAAASGATGKDYSTDIARIKGEIGEITNKKGDFQELAYIALGYYAAGYIDEADSIVDSLEEIQDKNGGWVNSDGEYPEVNSEALWAIAMKLQQPAPTPEIKITGLDPETITATGGYAKDSVKFDVNGEGFSQISDEDYVCVRAFKYSDGKTVMYIIDNDENDPSTYGVTVDRENNILHVTLPQGIPTGIYNLEISIDGEYGSTWKTFNNALEIKSAQVEELMEVKQIRLLQGGINDMPIDKPKPGQSYKVEFIVSNLQPYELEPLMIVQVKDAKDEAVNLGSIKTTVAGKKDVTSTIEFKLPQDANNADITVEVFLWSGWTTNANWQPLAETVEEKF